jgi:hypothetical protein
MMTGRDDAQFKMLLRIYDSDVLLIGSKIKTTTYLSLD